jgi:hypothetical protein
VQQEQLEKEVFKVLQEYKDLQEILLQLVLVHKDLQGLTEQMEQMELMVLKGLKGLKGFREMDPKDLKAPVLMEYRDHKGFKV